MAARRFSFLGVWAAVLSGVIGIAAAFNLAMDPYRYFGLEWRGINDRKPRPDIELTAIKRAAASHVQANAVVLGNSRADIGFDPDHPVWAARSLSAFNLAVPGSGIDAALRNLEWLSSRRQLRQVIVGLEFLDFLNEPDWAESAPAATGDPVTAAEKVRALFSVAALRDSVNTLGMRWDPYAATMTARGFNPLRDYIPIAAHDGYNLLFRQRAQDYARQYVKIGDRARDFERPKSRAIVALTRILALCRERKVDLALVIYPYHANMLLMIDGAELWDAFGDWKRTMTRLVAASASVPGGPSIQLWDFSGFHRYATEAIPQPGDRTTELAYYWEGGHFKKALGDLMLERILGNGGDRTFGALLTPDAVELVVVQQNAALSAYRAAHPAAAREIRQMLRMECRASGAVVQSRLCATIGSDTAATRPDTHSPGKGDLARARQD